VAVPLRLLTLATLCAVSTSAALAVTSPVITTRDNGKTFTVPPGATLTLRLPEHPRWLNPRVSGGAIRLTEVNFLRDPGYRQWSVSARTPGTARISAVRYAVSQTGCEPGPCAPRLFRVTIFVR
jgi:hypothetical protein